MRSQFPGLVNFTQKSKVKKKGGSCSDIIELDTQLICRQRKISIQPGHIFHRLEYTKSWDLTGICSPMMRDLLTDILILKIYCMDILSLFAVEGSLVPAFHVIFAEILWWWCDHRFEQRTAGGLGDAVRPLAGPEQSPGGGPGGEAPGSS